MIIVKIRVKNYNKICVVENISDQWAIESSSYFSRLLSYSWVEHFQTNNSQRQGRPADQLTH